ncbi:MAG: DNA polymerase III subunit delta [Candidatus Moraniibacteriota bacterium]
MLLLIHGEDGFLVNERRRALQDAFARKYPLAEAFIFDFEDQGTADDVRRALGACEGGLFATKKMIVFLHPFALGETGEKLLLDFLGHFVQKTETEVTLLFVSPGKTKKTHPLARFLAKHATEEVLGKLEEKAVTAHIRRELALIDAGAGFTHEALRIFIASVGIDTARIRTELGKLATFKPGGTFEAADVLLLVGAVPENAIFEALDALGRGDKKRALLLFHREASGPEGAHPILAMCAWQARRLLLVREAFDRGIRRVPDVAAETKLPPFAVQKMLGTIGLLPLARIKRGLAMLSDFDTQFKRGAMDPHVALDLFVWKF